VAALWTMAEAVGFDYWYVMCDPVANPTGVNADLRVPLDTLDATLTRVLADS
jgi:hypothetical protein